jgi:outer membrane cobalamin receptor
MSKKPSAFPAYALIAVLLTFLWSIAAFAQLNTSKIEGIVRDTDTGNPLPGVQVTVDGTRLGNVTNTDGYYFILNVAPGRKNITFMLTGYQKITVSEQLLLAGQTTTINAQLSSTIVEMGGITVVGEAEVMVPRDNTVSKQRMTAEKIAETPATKLEDLMVQEAGVQTGGEGGLARGIRIRGGRLGEEAMVVDGVTVRNYTANPFRSGQGWVYEQEVGSLSEDTTPLEFSTGAVEQVDIITGGFQAEYGNAQSGIVNIVTKEGSPDLRGQVRFTTDQQNPRTSDFGYNQLIASVGGPIPLVKNLFFQASGELQGQADRTPTHASEGFRGINQTFVDRLNQAVRNDPVLGALQPVFTLDGFQKGREFYASKTGLSKSLWSPRNPVRLPENWGDRTLTSGKLTYSPIQGLKFIGTGNFSRTQNSYPADDNGNYFKTGIATKSQLPEHDWSVEKDTILFIPQAFGRRTRTTNALAGFDWDFLHTSQRNATLMFRFSNFRTQDINSSSIKQDYRHDNTFMGWTPHDVPFQIETFPGRNYPLENTPEAKKLFWNGVGGWEREWAFETPFRLTQGEWLYWLNYRYLRERQNNFKGDVDFQLDRHNRAKFGVQFTDFQNKQFQIGGGYTRRDLANEFDYAPRMYAFYAQNRTDLGDFVLDYGIRFDEFQPRTNWGFRNFDQWGENFFPKNMSEWSPRFDVAFPVTDKSQMRFAYGVFTQLPSMSFIFDGANPGGLDYSRTDAFETGLSYLMGADLVLDLTAFYRDVDGNVASKEFFRDYYAYHIQRRFRDYQTGFTNQDNGNIKGMDAILRKRFSNNFAFNIMYTLQFSRTTGSQYNTTDNMDQFLDASTGESFRPPDEIRPINGDQTHKLTGTLNYLFPEDFKAGTWYNPILRDLRAYAVMTIASGPPAYDRIVYGGSTYFMNAAEDVSWLTRRGGRPIGGINYFRGRWAYNLDLRITKSFNLGGARRVSVFADVFNLTNNKLPTPYPSGYNYDGYYWVPNGGQELRWTDDYKANNLASWEKRIWFNADANQDGVLTLVEQAKADIAYSEMMATMDKTAWGNARQIRLGAEFTF